MSFFRTIQPGDVLWVAFPSRSPEGHEIIGSHPGIVLSNPSDYGECRFDTLIIIPTSSQINKYRLALPLYVTLPISSCFSKPSVALLDQVQAVCIKRIKSQIGSLDALQLATIKAAAKEILTLN